MRYEEIFITDYDGDMPELYANFSEYESIDELNYLASLLSEMDENDLEKFEAVLDTGEHSGSVKELINLTQNLDCFEFYSGITSEEELGRMYIQEFDAIPIPEHLIDYIDYEAYGRDVRINEGGSFSGNGYVFDNNSSFIEHYSDREDIPDGYRVFSMPELTIRERMVAYKEVSDKAAQHSKPVPEAGRDDR